MIADTGVVSMKGLNRLLYIHENVWRRTKQSYMHSFTVEPYLLGTPESNFSCVMRLEFLLLKLGEGSTATFHVLSVSNVSLLVGQRKLISEIRKKGESSFNFKSSACLDPISDTTNLSHISSATLLTQLVFQSTHKIAQYDTYSCIAYLNPNGSEPIYTHIYASAFSQSTEHCVTRPILSFFSLLSCSCHITLFQPFWSPLFPPNHQVHSSLKALALATL